MFTLDQINDIHERLGKQATLIEYLRALNAIGVEKYDSFISDGHSEYLGNSQSKSKFLLLPCTRSSQIADTSNRENLLGAAEPA